MIYEYVINFYSLMYVQLSKMLLIIKDLKLEVEMINHPSFWLLISIQ